MKHVFLSSLFFAIIINIINAQQRSPFGEADSSFSINNIKIFTHEASYIGDVIGNVSGGRKTGAMFLGMANIKIGFETKNLGLWKGGEFFLNGASTHGGTPSEKLLGDFQVASNIEAGNHTYLHELWYKHSFETFEIIIGLQDLNAEFVTSEYAGSFINSSFGIPSLIADNIPVPIFPLTALGIAGKYQISKNVALQAAIFDGLPEDFEGNQYNVNWDLKSNDGVLIFSELQFATNFGDMPGNVKAGYYYHSHLKETCPETKITETVFDKNYGFYAVADQRIYQFSENRGLGLFAQLAVSPTNINSHNYYFGGGINYTGIFDNEGEDVMGIAFAHAGFRDSSLKNETTIEMFYRVSITENLFAQPDIQYIINPAGTENNLNNALAFFMRFGINF